MKLDYRLIHDPTAPIGHLSVADQRRVCEMRTAYQMDMASKVGEDCSQPDRIAQLLGPRVVGLKIEHLFLLLLDAQLRLVCEPILQSKGTQSDCDVDPRAVMRSALAHPTCGAFALCHNHPTGSLDVGDADRAITKRLALAASVVGFRFVDHLIVCSPTSFTSMRQRYPACFQGAVI
jgi:DNA repair protein RadC